MWKELDNQTIVVFDYETNGFLDVVDEVHCAVTIDARTNESEEYTPLDVHQCHETLDRFNIIVGHNIIGYDLPMLQKIYGYTVHPDTIILDTLVMSRMYQPDIEGGHSLKAWGERMGNSKGDYGEQEEAWDMFTPAMLEYCEQDVKVNVQLFWKLADLLKNFSWQSIKCEMDTALIIQRQMQHGFVFDMIGAEKLHAKLTERILEIEEEVHQTFLPLPKAIREVQPKIKKDLTVSSVGLSKLEGWENSIRVPEHTVTKGETKDTVEYHSGAFTLIDYPEFSLGSRQQIANRLIRAGYTLTKFTPKTDSGGGGNPIIDDVVLKEASDAGIPEAKPLAEYFMISKVEAMVKSWIAKAKWHEDQGVYRIHGYVNTLGANSHRMTHSNPNLGQVPAAKMNKDTHEPIWGAGSNYGTDCRNLFTVRKKYKLVGCDASGLELRTLAHYMNDPKYTKELLEGDIHTANQKAAGLETRDQAKTFIYAFLYGGGDAKIGQIVGGNSRAGKKLKDEFLLSTPALKRLREGVLNAVAHRKWLKGMDGRILRIRSAHSALNTLLQGAGAIIMKYWAIEVAKVADKEELDWNPCMTVHDELQSEVAEKDVERFMEICVDSFPKISLDLKSNCLLEGEAMAGNTWLETH